MFLSVNSICSNDSVGRVGLAYFHANINTREIASPVGRICCCVGNLFSFWLTAWLEKKSHYQVKVTKSLSTSATKLSHKHTTFDSVLHHSICTERCWTVVFRTTAQSSLGAHYVLSLLRNSPSSAGELGAKVKIHLDEQEGWMCIIALEHIQITESEMTTGKIAFYIKCLLVWCSG